MQFSIHSNIYTCFSPHNGTLKKAYSSFLKLHITNQRCILNKKLHSSNSNRKVSKIQFLAGLLTYSIFLTPFPFLKSGTVDLSIVGKLLAELTAARLFRDLHLIPFFTTLSVESEK